MGIIQNTIRWYLDKGYVKRVIIMGLDHSGKTTTMKGLINDYSYVKMIPLEDQGLFDYAYSEYQIYDRFEPLDRYTYMVNSNVDTDTKLSPEFTDMMLNEAKARIDKYYSNPLFVVYLHDMFMDDESKKYHQAVLENKKVILNRYLEIIKRYSKFYPFIIVTERSFKLLGKGAIYGHYEL